MKLLNRTVFLAVLLLIAGCRNIDKSNYSDSQIPKYMTSDELLLKMQQAVDPTDELDNIKSLQYSVSRVILDNHYSPEEKKMNWVFCYHHKNPEIYDVTIEKIKTSKDKRKENKLNLVIYEDKHKIYENGKEISIEDLGRDKFNKLREHALEFKLRAFFGLYSDILSSKLSHKIYNVEGHNCYKMAVALEINLFDESNKVIFYVDCKDYLIRKISTEYFDISNIRYKLVDNIVLMQKLTMKERAFNKTTEHVEFEHFRVNDKMDFSKYEEMALEGKDI